MPTDATAAERQRRRRERLKMEQAAGEPVDVNEDGTDLDDEDDAEDAGGETLASPPASTKPANGDGKRYVEVIYRPSAEEPSQTVWNKIKFLANVPVTLDRQNLAHGYDVLMPEFKNHPMTGQRMSNHVETWMFMGDLAKGPWMWEVDGVRTQRIIPDPKKKVPPAGMEWAGTDRAEVIDSATVAYPDDYDPNADGIVISGRR